MTVKGKPKYDKHKRSRSYAERLRELFLPRRNKIKKKKQTILPNQEYMKTETRHGSNYKWQMKWGISECKLSPSPLPP